MPNTVANENVDIMSFSTGTNPSCIKTLNWKVK